MRLSCNFVNVYTLRARIPNIHAWNPNPDSSNRIFPNSFLRRCYKLGYMEKNITQIFWPCFRKLMMCRFVPYWVIISHVLYTYLSECFDTAYSLRTRNHNKFLRLILMPKTSDLGDRHFIIRSLYKNSLSILSRFYMSILYVVIVIYKFLLLHYN